MSDNKATTRTEGRNLYLERVYNATPEKLFQAWTDPELMKKWFCPRPWTVASVDNDVRAGGASTVVMRSPDGQEFPSHGVFLEVVPNKKIVFTDAFTSAWQPSEKAFMVGEVTFKDLGNGKTRYLACVRHWSEEDRQAHEKMGFHEGWAKAAEQLAEIVEDR